MQQNCLPITKLGTMNTVTYLALIGIISLLLFARDGFSSAGITGVAITAIIAAIPWYFGTRNRSTSANLLEVVLATLWVWFRRLVGVVAGSFFLFGAWKAATAETWGNGAASPWVAAVVLAGFGIFSLYVGIVGQGWNKADWRDDVALHQNNKRRYKWWF